MKNSGPCRNRTYNLLVPDCPSEGANSDEKASYTGVARGRKARSGPKHGPEGATQVQPQNRSSNLRKVSAKRLAANPTLAFSRSTILPSSSAQRPRKPASSKPRTRVKNVNRRRRAKEFKRCYGSAARVEWVKNRPCYVCHREATAERLNENAHIVGGGAGRKSDAEKIVPLCPTCHAELHALQPVAFEAKHGVSLELAAEATERAWSRLAEQGVGGER